MIKIKKKYKATFLFLIALAFIKPATAQSIIDTSDTRIAYYRSSIERNKDKVQFIEYTLQMQGIPKALKNLALIESDFNNMAVSTSKAAGTWQFMPGTAVVYGLKTGAVNDERHDLYKSTYAASLLLRNLYEQYKDWTCVIAAYSCGTGGVNRAMEKAGSNRYEDFYRYLPAETILHVYKFLVACYATGEMDILNSKLSQINMEASVPVNNATETNGVDTASISIGAGYDLNEIALQLQMSLQDLKILNPCFNEELEGKGATLLHLPVDKMPDFILLKNELLKKSLANIHQ